jgi:hypothetical protein
MALCLFYSSLFSMGFYPLCKTCFFIIVLQMLMLFHCFTGRVSPKWAISHYSGTNKIASVNTFRETFCEMGFVMNLIVDPQKQIPGVQGRYLPICYGPVCFVSV